MRLFCSLSTTVDFTLLYLYGHPVFLRENWEEITVPQSLFDNFSVTIPKCIMKKLWTTRVSREKNNKNTSLFFYLRTKLYSLAPICNKYEKTQMGKACHVGFFSILLHSVNKSHKKFSLYFKLRLSRHI